MFSDKETLEKKISRYAKKVQNMTIFVQKQDIGVPWEYQKVLALTDSTKKGRKSIVVAAGLASAFESKLIVGITRPDPDVKSFLKASLEIHQLVEFGDYEPHKKGENDELQPWTEGLLDDDSIDVKVQILPGRAIEEVTRFIERKNVDLVILHAHYGPKEDNEVDSEATEGLSLFTRIIAYETPASVFLVRKRIVPPKPAENQENDDNNNAKRAKEDIDD